MQPSKTLLLISKLTLPILGLALGTVFLVFTQTHQKADFSDFNVYYTAGIKALHHQTLYDVRTALQFKYAPITGVLFGFLFGHYTFEQVTPVFYFLNLISWIVLAVAISYSFYFRSVGPKKELPLRNFLIWGLSIFLLFCGVGLRDELKLGQINIVPISLFFVFLLGLDPGKNLRTSQNFAKNLFLGITYSVACQFKLYCWIALPLLVYRRQFAILGWALMTYLVLNLGILGFYSGWNFALSETKDWLTTLTHSTTGLLDSRYSVSALSAVLKITRSSLVANTFWLFAVTVFLFLQYRYRQKDGYFQFAFLVLAIILLSPVSWPCWMAWGFPALLLVGNRLARNQPSSLLFWGPLLFFNMGNLNSGSTYWGMPALTTLFLLGLLIWSVQRENHNG